MPEPSIVIPGGSGFLGRTLTSWFAHQGARVIILSRHPQDIPGATVVPWDAQSLGPWANELEGVLAVINLAGRSVNCRYTTSNRQLMMDSRTKSTAILGEAISACQDPPQVWLNSSTATIYRHREDAPNTEAAGLYGPVAEAKDKYSVEVAHAWEEAFEEAFATRPLPQTRGILLRTAIVLGAEPGGAYHTLRRLSLIGLGGTMGHGRQYVSWMHALDFCRAISWLIETDSAEGIYNLAAPHPAPNREMMKQLRHSLHVSAGLPAPRWMLEVGAFALRTETELIVKSRRVIPERLQQEGFTFTFPSLDHAFSDLAGQKESPSERPKPNN
ncbi:MAG: TIGR01777 family oxidoreductase [Verrucomicrobiota bacterium]